MKFKILVVIKLFVLFCCFKECITAKDEIVKLVEEDGYICEVHRVETKDGYLLKLNRVVKKGQTEMPQLGVVFLMHGMFATAADFVITRSKIAIAYYLVDNGYDVWLGNARGSKYGMKHKTLKVNTKQFWTFSWHEIGVYDLPAMIDHALKTTNKTKIFYVGHSQGTTVLTVLLSMLPEYNDIIIQAHFMAPAVFMSNTPIQFFKSWGAEVMNTIQRSGMYQSFPLMSILEKMSNLLCTESFKPTLEICSNMFLSIVGYNQYEVELEMSVLTNLVQNISPFISTMQLIHFIQTMLSGKFRQYDHKDQNMKFYNSTSPPEYDLNKIKAPIYLYHGENDAIVSELDTEILKAKQSNVRDYQVLTNWNHADFDYGKNSRSVLYSSILESFNNEGMPVTNVSSSMYNE